jgi:hypothetical protein
LENIIKVRKINRQSKERKARRDQSTAEKREDAVGRDDEQLLHWQECWQECYLFLSSSACCLPDPLGRGAGIALDYPTYKF